VYDFETPFSPKPVSSVIIPKHASAKKIGELLEQEGIIPSALLFYVNVRLRGIGVSLRSGEYHFPSPQSLQTIITVLQQGKVVLHQITIPEGLTTREIKALLMQEDKLSGALNGEIVEGSLLPETYTFVRGETRQALINTMHDAMQKNLEIVWLNRQQGLPFMLPSEALILASIVEKETAVEAERGLVASVFVNRLRKGMLLQSDPTIIYALTLEENNAFKRALSRTDLKYISPYNTYLNPGLPPSPICHPGLASLKAVLNPPQTNYIFFVADGTGGHIFAQTYKEHQQNHAAWRRIRDRKQ
jgi:peptidoglycan lytic transglycosylase G